MANTPSLLTALQLVLSTGLAASVLTTVLTWLLVHRPKRRLSRQQLLSDLVARYATLGYVDEDWARRVAMLNLIKAIAVDRKPDQAIAAWIAEEKELTVPAVKLVQGANEAWNRKMHIQAEMRSLGGRMRCLCWSRPTDQKKQEQLRAQLDEIHSQLEKLEEQETQASEDYANIRQRLAERQLTYLHKRD